ncbi:MAG: SDR family oxidoreductase [Bacteroidetes bacterium]|nr:MAG: SDR family oxidoreductase [Bacteroidota bacterium]
MENECKRTLLGIKNEVEKYNIHILLKISEKMPQSFALIIGAMGGMGKSFAQHLAARKYNLFITDINIKGLQEMAEGLKKQYAVEIKTEAVDLTDDQELCMFAKRLMSSDNIGMFVNCAGFGEGETFCEEKIERQLKMIQVHISATVQLTHAVLPGMIKRKRGKIIIISSMSAFIPAPGNSIYAGTKAFLNTFMESIHMEVHKHGVRVQSLCPGLTRTGFHERLKKEGKRSQLSKVVPWMDADKVVDYSLKCLDKGKVVCIPGCFNKIIKKGIPILPRKSFYSLSKKIAEQNLRQ